MTPEQLEALLTALLDKLKLKYETALADPTIKEYLTDSITDIVYFTHQTDLYVAEKLKGAIVNLTIEKLNTKGSEGLNSQSNSGASETYIDDISKPIKAVLIRHRKVLR